jgi:hypothetical protein
MTHLREAALALHALEPDDRAWLIERLTPAQQRAVAPLLSELAELGIPADARLVDEALRHSARSITRGAQQRIAALQAAQAAQLLRGEPAPFVACVLGLAAWPWTPAYIASLDASAQRQLQDAMHDAPAATASLRAWLIETLAARIDTDAVALDAPVRLAWTAGDLR